MAHVLSLLRRLSACSQLSTVPISRATQRSILLGMAERIQLTMRLPCSWLTRSLLPLYTTMVQPACCPMGTFRPPPVRSHPQPVDQVEDMCCPVFLSSLGGLTSAEIPTTTSSTGAQAQSSIPPLRLGDGIPAGSVTDLIDDPIVLGFIDISVFPAGRVVKARDLRGRQLLSNPVETAIQTAVSAAQATATANWIVSGSSQPVNCNVATPYTLVSGRLINNGTAVGKYNGSTTAVFGQLLSGNANPIVDTGFAFINGILAWQAPDVGVALFYNCGGTIYAAFDPTSLLGDAPAPYNNCNQVALGGIASASCQAHLAAVALQSASSPSIITPLSSFSLNGFSIGSSIHWNHRFRRRDQPTYTRLGVSPVRSHLIKYVISLFFAIQYAQWFRDICLCRANRSTNHLCCRLWSSLR